MLNKNFIFLIFLIKVVFFSLFGSVIKCWCNKKILKVVVKNGIVILVKLLI